MCHICVKIECMFTDGRALNQCNKTVTPSVTNGSGPNGYLNAYSSYGSHPQGNTAAYAAYTAGYNAQSYTSQQVEHSTVIIYFTNEGNKQTRV